MLELSQHLSCIPESSYPKALLILKLYYRIFKAPVSIYVTFYGLLVVIVPKKYYGCILFNWEVHLVQCCSRVEAAQFPLNME